MPFQLRFVQRFRPDRAEEFLELGKQFAALEKKMPGWPRGRRMRPFSGRDPVHTLIWECEFPTLQDAQAAVGTFDADPGHARLFALQSPAMLDAYTEIYEILDY